MSFPLPLLLAEITGAQWIAIVAIIFGVLLTALVIFLGIRFSLRRQELWHETARVALEKGQPLPPLPAEMQHEQHPDEGNDYRAGLILVATGAGLYLFFANFLPGLRFVATIPGFIGVALLVFAMFKSKKNPPQS